MATRADTKEMARDLTATTNRRIVEVRGVRALLDRHVADIFGVEVRKLNQQVSRNEDKFLEDFAFRLTWEEFNDLRSQNVIFQEWTKVTYPPIAFTEHGVVMAATVLKSVEAIRATQAIVRTFVEHRKLVWEQEQARRMGAQLPLALDAPMRQGLATKLNMALGHVLDAIVDPSQNRTVRDEAREIAAEGLKTLKDYLKKAGISNEKTLAEVRKIMAEAESIEVEAQRKKTENRHRELALVAKQLRLVIQAQAYAETGSVDGLMVVLQDLEKSS